MINQPPCQEAAVQVCRSNTAPCYYLGHPAALWITPCARGRPARATRLVRGKASPAHLAYLEDRVRVNAGQPQRYGTQFTVTGGEFGPHPIEDPHRLDERRAEAGLEPFADYQARMQARS